MSVLGVAVNMAESVPRGSGGSLHNPTKSVGKDNSAAQCSKCVV